MRLDDTIAEAAVRAAASHTEWEQKHHPVRIDGKTYWLSTDIPRTIHIIVSSLRFEDRPADPRYMCLRPDGTVKPWEYLAGYARPDTQLRTMFPRNLTEIGGIYTVRSFRLSGLLLGNRCPNRSGIPKAVL